MDTKFKEKLENEWKKQKVEECKHLEKYYIGKIEELTGLVLKPEVIYKIAYYTNLFVTVNEFIKKEESEDGKEEK